MHRNGRAQIYKLAKQGDWGNKHKFYVGDRDDVKGEYSDLISRAKFCLVAAGELQATGGSATRHAHGIEAGTDTCISVPARARSDCLMPVLPRCCPVAYVIAFTLLLSAAR